MVEDDIRRLCQKYSELDVSDIDEIIKEANNIEKSIRYQNEDVFIDILSDVTDEAIVVYHRRPKLKESIYQETVVGKVAKRLNEPGVYRTFETSLNTEGLLAKTQENKLIRQKVFPIRNNQRNIGVLIIEAPVNETIGEQFYFSNQEDGSQRPVTQPIAFYKNLINKLDEAILIFDKEGHLIINNEVAESYYYHFGYMEKINGFHYDNLSLDTSTFEQLLYLRNAGKWEEVAEKEIFFGETHFKMSRFFDDDTEMFSMILHDKTEIYNKEVEIITKSVAIKEIHHRVKNNLQSIVSLLRIQSRRSESEEVKKLLRESETRILAISTAHELLSKQIADDISLVSVLDLTINNVHRSFLGSKQIALEKYIDETIFLDSDKTVSLALIVNELLQNSFEHGFTKEDPQNLIQIEVTKIDDDTISVVIQDNGVGYHAKKSNRSSLGLKIVSSYVKEKLRGKLHIKSNHFGTTTRFYFKQ
ncbi:histidine kinase N-terminal domain-containing protein [Vagococcus sp. BWB3-3]|uniref:histidine kinase n=1 Tax=Vagococcus allomyrinae TaxID=2794353 RepID=A0A940PC94_9ENTE|nr:histidine kinase N-terminal domain-containing protein [Vagococcus allomyrinae]MBP1040836.1 histidine kinase N-terminal domain-containing protein [Vagococcus allomyrinae]